MFGKNAYVECGGNHPSFGVQTEDCYSVIHVEIDCEGAKRVPVKHSRTRSTASIFR